MAETSAQAVGRLSVVLGIGLGVLVSSIAAAEACGAYFARNVSTTVGTAGTAGPHQNGDSGGCACTVTQGGAGPAGAGALLLLVAGLVAARRARPSRARITRARRARRGAAR